MTRPGGLHAQIFLQAGRAFVAASAFFFKDLVRLRCEQERKGPKK